MTVANGAGVPTEADLARCEGANPTAKALTYVRQHKLVAPGASFDVEHEAASRLLNEIARGPQQPGARY